LHISIADTIMHRPEPTKDRESNGRPLA